MEEAQKRLNEWMKNTSNELDLSELDLISLPKISRSCVRLGCCDNQLTELPDLPNCQTLYCYYNQLTTLPDLPKCQKLYCSNNQLTTLPDLPNCQRLYCDHNPYLHITKEQAERFLLTETPNYNAMAIRIQRRFRQRKKYMFLKSLQRHINEFLSRPNNYLYYLAKQRFEMLSTKN